ncbi:MAG: class I SAM-dependent methyltransferase family protein, partial [Candidatus Hydrothermarchaeota archaeon]
ARVHLAGEERGVAVHLEHGCQYKMDIRKVYFSPRLGYERRRVLERVDKGETVVDLFAGVGPFSIPLAKYRGAKVYAVDINPAAVDYLRENVRLNKVEGLVVPLLGDCRAVTPRGVADRVIMNLPKRSLEFLDVALGALKGGGIIHLYAIAPQEDLYTALEGEIRKAFQGLGKGMEVLERRVVRPYSPRQYHVVLDIKVTSRS